MGTQVGIQHITQKVRYGVISSVQGLRNIQVKACCTYCSIEIDSSPGLLAAKQRWGSARVNSAERFAADQKMPLRLLMAERGLLAPEDRVRPGGASLIDEEISRKARLVESQPKDMGIRQLQPSNRLALAYLRLIVLACDRANTTLTLLDHRGRPFADWSKAYRQEQEASRHVLKASGSVDNAFAEVFRKFGDEDGMIWFQRGQAFMARNQPARALADFRQAAQLFPMKEWRDAANNAADVTAKQIPSVPSLGVSIRNELEEIDRLARDLDVRKLSREAVRVAVESPSASILLCGAAFERAKVHLNRLPRDIASKIGELRRYRNDVAHGSLTAEPEQGIFCRKVLLDVLRFLEKHQWRK
jgi:hypothetical protein